MRLRTVLTALSVSLMAGVYAPAAAAETFVAPVQEVDQVWFYAPAALLNEPDGTPLVLLYQVLKAGVKVGPRSGAAGHNPSIHYTVSAVAYDCAARTVTPIAIRLFDDAFASIGNQQNFADPKAISTTPDSRFGRVVAALCGALQKPEQMLTGDSWQVVAKAQLAALQAR